jgi:Tfp pilus assembly PilM family ATPase
LADHKSISSTEKLLDVIRADAHSTDHAQHSADSPEGTGGKTSSGRPRRSLSLGAKAVVGVEFLENSVRFVKMTRAAGYWKADEAFSAYLKKGQSQESPEFPSLLRNSLKNIQGIKKAEIWAMIPAYKGEVWQINVPMVKKDIYNAVFWTAKKEKNFDEKTTYFDYRLLGETTDNGAKKISTEVFTAPSEEIDFLKTTFAKAGFTLHGVTLFSFALRNLFLTKRIDTGNGSFAVLFIGRDSSNIDVYRGNNLVLSRVIKTGTSGMVEAILETRSDIDFPGDTPPPPDGERAIEIIGSIETENVPQGERDLSRGYSPEETFSLITPAMERLARQVERTIDHSVNVLDNPSPNALFICGSLTTAPRVSAFFQEQLGIAVRVLDPLSPSMPHVSPGITSLNKSERMSLASAASLAMSSNEYTPNFLYTAMDRQKHKAARRAGAFAVILMLVLLLITGAYWHQSGRELAKARQHTTALKQELNQFSPQFTGEEVTLLAGKYVKKNSLLRDYTRRLVSVSVISELSAITPANIRLLNVRLDMGRPEAKTLGLVVVEGFVSGENISFETYLSSYLFGLRNSPIFEDTVIHSSGFEELEGAGRVLRFVVNVNLKQAGDEKI